MIGVDSDGCVFDSMELKHKECFCPAFINHFGLQGVSRAARETWEFVNLYSCHRGLNRFLAVQKALALLSERPGVEISLTKDELDTWLKSESGPSEGTLARFLDNCDPGLPPESILNRCLHWSRDVAEAVKRIVHDLPPIPEAARALEQFQQEADCVVVSQTPTPDLNREWAEHGIAGYARMIAGQELGSKKEHLAMAAGGKYAPDHVLMIGDSPGDQRAAESNGFLFFPIVPGRERDSWQNLLDQGLTRFFNGTFAGHYQEECLQTFQRSLPEHPPWAL